MRLELSGGKGLLALAVVAVVVAVRIATLGETDDPALTQAVRARLADALAGSSEARLAAARARIEHGEIGDDLEPASAVDLSILAIRVSKPLLTFSSNAEAVVGVEYSEPGVGRRTVYWRYRHGALGGWTYRGRASAVSYYLNFF